MNMIVASGIMEDGTYRVKLSYRSLTHDELLNILYEIRARYSYGIKHLGTNISMIQVENKKKMIRSISDIDFFIKEYDNEVI